MDNTKEQKKSAAASAVKKTVSKPSNKATNELRYKGLSLIYMQLFTLDKFDSKWLDAAGFTTPEKSIDNEIFLETTGDDKPVGHYRRKGNIMVTELAEDGLKHKVTKAVDGVGFDFEIEMKNPQLLNTVSINGHMFVELSIFFDRTVSLTYHMVLDGSYCEVEGELTTDHIIALASLNKGAEHWNDDDEDEQEDAPKKTKDSTIVEKNKITIRNFPIDPYGGWSPKQNLLCPEEYEDCLGEVQRRFKLFITGGQSGDTLDDLNYVYVDVWDNISHKTKGFFEKKSEAEVISYIENSLHKELIGLMSLYPYEWDYRDPRCLGDVCGSNIAIDTDDLILVNEDMCVAFGTYGRRGKGYPTNWVKHLANVRGYYHVSWPEYMLILEIILARKCTVSYALDRFMKDTDLGMNPDDGDREMIEANAHTSVDITKLLMRMNAVKYTRCVSHKIMFERTSLRLGIDGECRALDDTMEKINDALVNISEQRKWKQSNFMNKVLLALSLLSAASLLNILFQDLDISFFTEQGMEATMAQKIGMYIIGFTLLLLAAVVCWGIFMLVKYCYKWIKKRINK